MSFRVRPNHDRVFNSLPSQLENINEDENWGSEEEDDNMIEESVFIVDEETGEIREEKQMVQSDTPKRKIENTVNYTNLTNINVPTQYPDFLPRRDTPKFVGLAMKKRTKVSFM